jgi:hypothetical protein
MASPVTLNKRPLMPSPIGMAIGFRYQLQRFHEQDLLYRPSQWYVHCLPQGAAVLPEQVYHHFHALIQGRLKFREVYCRCQTVRLPITATDN